jgi:hypothetical protein
VDLGDFSWCATSGGVALRLCGVAQLLRASYQLRFAVAVTSYQWCQLCGASSSDAPILVPALWCAILVPVLWC